MPREEASTFQFILCSIWKPGDSNFWVKICLALEESIFQVEWLIATLIIYRVTVRFDASIAESVPVENLFNWNRWKSTLGKRYIRVNLNQETEMVLQNFFKPSVWTNYGTSTFNFSATKIWESVPLEFKCSPYMLFKKQYKRFLLSTQN